MVGEESKQHLRIPSCQSLIASHKSKLELHDTRSKQDELAAR